MPPSDAVDTLRDISGHAPRAGVGEADGEGESLRKEGCSRTSWLVVAAMII